MHDRIEGTAPVFVRIVHHDIDEHGHEKGQDRGAITYLIPVDPAVPGSLRRGRAGCEGRRSLSNTRLRTSTVSPHPQGSHESTLRGPEPFLPVFVPADTVVVLPERIEHIAVVQKNPDGSREVVPYGVVHPLTGIESHHLPEVGGERGPLPGRRVVELLFIRIGRIEADPLEDEPPVVIGYVFGSADSANRGVHAQSHRLRKSVAQFPLLGLQDCVGEGNWGGTFVSSRQPARPRLADLSGTLAPAPLEIQMGRIVIVLEEANPEGGAALRNTSRGCRPAHRKRQ